MGMLELSKIGLSSTVLSSGSATIVIEILVGLAFSNGHKYNEFISRLPACQVKQCYISKFSHMFPAQGYL